MHIRRTPRSPRRRRECRACPPPHGDARVRGSPRGDASRRLLPSRPGRPRARPARPRRSSPLRQCRMRRRSTMATLPLRSNILDYSCVLSNVLDLAAQPLERNQTPTAAATKHTSSRGHQCRPHWAASVRRPTPARVSRVATSKRHDRGRRRQRFRRADAAHVESGHHRHEHADGEQRVENRQRVGHRRATRSPAPSPPTPLTSVVMRATFSTVRSEAADSGSGDTDPATATSSA